MYLWNPTHIFTFYPKQYLFLSIAIPFKFGLLFREHVADVQNSARTEAWQRQMQIPEEECGLNVLSDIIHGSICPLLHDKSNDYKLQHLIISIIQKYSAFYTNI